MRGHLLVIFQAIWQLLKKPYDYLSSETVSFFLPLALLLFKTLRPLAVDILSRNPCLFFLFLTDG